MLNSSLRRVARSCPNANLPSRPTTPSIASFSSRSHQRRHSSSKPPVPPNNGSSTISASIKQVGASRSESKKPAAESRLSKRKATKAEPVEEVQQANWTTGLPSVASTDYLNPKDLSISRFYSLHRPLSVHGATLKETSMEEIDKIFQPKPKSKFKVAQPEVIYTLSSALENLDQQIADKQSSQQDSNVTQKADLIKTLTQHNDPNNQQTPDQHQTINVQIPKGAVKLVIQEIQNRFRPFNVPPPPTPVSQSELEIIDAQQAASEAGDEVLAQKLDEQIQQEGAEAAAARGRRDRSKIEAQLQQQDQHTRSSTKPLNEIPVAEVFHNKDETFSFDMDMQNGHFFTPHYAENTKSSSTTRRAKPVTRSRRGVYVPVHVLLLRKPGMRAISVKRQRKLKMNRHKLRKQRKKTRSLREKQGRL